MDGTIFTITGTVNNQKVVVQCFGPPEGETVDSTISSPEPKYSNPNSVVYFDTITSITANDDLDAVQVGIGVVGITKWFALDDMVPFSGLGVQVFTTTNKIFYTFYHTLFDVIGPTDLTLWNNDNGSLLNMGIVVPNPDANHAYTVVFNGDSTASGYAALMTPTRYCAIKVSNLDTLTANPPFGGESLLAQFVHQGITT